MDQELRRDVVKLMAEMGSEIDRTTPAGKALAESIEAMLQAIDAYLQER